MSVFSWLVHGPKDVGEVDPDSSAAKKAAHTAWKNAKTGLPRERKRTMQEEVSER